MVLSKYHYQKPSDNFHPTCIVSLLVFSFFLDLYVFLFRSTPMKLDRTFGDLDNFLTTRALRLRAGSVEVPFTVTVDDTSSTKTDEVETTFDVAVESGSRELIANGVQTYLYLEELLPSSPM